MLLSDEELARLIAIAPFLQSEARTSLEFEAGYEVTVELADHLQPGLRIRTPALTGSEADADVPPYPVDLFVGIPLEELRTLANASDTDRDPALAHFGARFSPRLLRAIAKMTPHEIDLEVGMQKYAGTLAVMLEKD